MVVSNVPLQRDLRDDLNANRRRRRNKGAPRGPKDGESKDERQRPAIDRQLPEPRVKEGKQEQGQHQPRPKPQRVKRGCNTRDFEPSQAPPGLKVVVGDASKATLGKKLHGRHVVYVPNFYCEEEDASVYEKLMQEVKAAGSPDMWVPWHEDSHFIANDRDRHGKWKQESPIFMAVVDRIAKYFKMDVKATRFNWYRDAEEWKPYHHDAAAVKPDKAKTQNCTVAVSFGACRDAAFEHAKTGTTVFFPQGNGSAYTFGHDVNCEWRHGIPQVPEELRKEGGIQNARRVSIIAWGWVDQDRDDISAFKN